jgi:predicted membrane-bound spermidine synthase
MQLKISEPNVVRFIVFTSGAIVMGVEIMASRLLAPYYGDTVYVWGSLIAVIMTALAIGYRQGGKKADEYSSYIELSNIILIAGVFVILIPITAPFILEIVRIFRIPSIYEPLLPSALLLGVPTVYLGMVSPYSLKLSAKNLLDIGGVSGGLSSLNTIGGILGTFLTVFFLVPNFGTREIITGMGVVLVAISLIGRERSYFIGIGALLFILLVPSNLLLAKLMTFGSGAHVYSSETPYCSLAVVDNRLSGVRTLFLDDLSHSAMYLNGSVKPVYRYTDYFNLAFGYNLNISKVLFIGGGGFSGPKQFLVDYPWLEIDVVEIDPEVVEVAHRFFNLPLNNSRLGIYVEDGRKFLQSSGKYDLIVLDAYSHTYVPFHLMTYEFTALVNSRLNTGGLLVSNIIGSTIGDTSELLWSEVLTVRENIPYITLYRTRDTPESIVQNIILVACKEDPPSQDELYENFQNLNYGERFTGFLDYNYKGTYPENRLILKDNYAPVEDMLNPVTLTSYDREGRLNPQNVLNPLFIAGLWAVSLGSLYTLSKKIS